MKSYQGHDLLSTLFDDCKRYNSLSDDIAWACVLHLVGSVGQYRFQTPGGSTSLFQMVVVPMGAGKEGYRRWVEAYSRVIHTKLIGDEYRSDQAMKLGLTEHASRSLIVDEIADGMIAAYSSKNNHIPAGLQTIYNRLYNSLPYLEGSKTKEHTIDGVNRPRLSILGFTTDDQFENLMKIPEFVGNGAFSRYQTHLIQSDEYELYDDERQLEITPDPALVLRLRSIFDGFTTKGKDVAGDVVVPLEFDKQALHKFKAYAQAARLDAFGVERKHRGMHRRGREVTARKMASIRALACERTVIMPPDVSFGIAEADRAWSRMSAVLAGSGLSELAHLQHAILAKIRAVASAGETEPLISVLRNSIDSWRKMDATKFADAVHALTRVGQIAYSPSKKRVSLCAGEVPLTAEIYGDNHDRELVAN